MGCNKHQDVNCGLRVVLDTNAVLDWLCFVDADFSSIDRAIDSGLIIPITSQACLDELHRVLASKELGLDAGASSALLHQYEASAMLCDIEGKATDIALPRCTDKDDQKFLELAHQGRAQYLVTRDKALLRVSRHALRTGGFEVLSPRQFSELLNLRQIAVGVRELR